MGHAVSSKGLKLSLSEIEAILTMDLPKDKGCVESLRGILNYLLKSLPKLPVHDSAFQELKHLLMQAQVLAYFDLTKKLSRPRLGVALLQEEKPVAYAELTETLRQYTRPAIRTCLLLSLEKWHKYTLSPLVVM